MPNTLISTSEFIRGAKGVAKDVLSQELGRKPTAEEVNGLVIRGLSGLGVGEHRLLQVEIAQNDRPLS